MKGKNEYWAVIQRNGQRYFLHAKPMSFYAAEQRVQDYIAVTLARRPQPIGLVMKIAKVIK